MEIINYISSYLMIGMILSFIFEILNDYMFHSDNPDKVKFDFGIRTINIFLWPYILCVLIKAMIDNYYVIK